MSTCEHGRGQPDYAGACTVSHFVSVTHAIAPAAAAHETMALVRIAKQPHCHRLIEGAAIAPPSSTRGSAGSAKWTVGSRAMTVSGVPLYANASADTSIPTTVLGGNALV